MANQNEDKIKKLTKRYFIEQKIFEIGILITIIILGAYLLPWLDKTLCTSGEMCLVEHDPYIGGFVMLLILILIGVVLSGVLSVLYTIITNFIMWNWNKAEERARRDVE